MLINGNGWYFFQKFGVIKKYFFQKFWSYFGVFSNITAKEKVSHTYTAKVSYTFPYKEAKFSKLKYFIIIIIKRFFSFCNIFFFTQPVYFFHFLRKNF